VGKTKIEAPQILSLLIKRSLEWQRLGGLTSPAKVREATESYLEEQDSFASWIEEKVRDQRKISFVPCRAVPIVEDICRSCGRVTGSMKEYAKPTRASEIGISSLDGWRVTDGAGFRISKKTAYHNVQMSAADSNHAGVETQIIR
jgi:hypothetical protein